LEKVRIGIINYTINMLDFMLAEHAGLYREQGLEVEFDTLGGLRSIQALVDGELDVVVSIGAAARAIMKDATPVKVALLVHRNGPHWVMGRPGIDDVRDLKGGSVQAGDRGTEPDLMVRKWLTASGLEPDVDVELTYERVHTAWTENGPRPAEDGVIARTLERDALDSMGFRPLVELASTYPNTLVHGLVMLDRTIAERPQVVRGLVAAHREVSRWIDDANDDVVRYIEQTWSVSEERARAAAKFVNGVFTARRELSDFGPVLASSAAALGMPAIAPGDLLANVDGL
jgi:ABC-type nitrate/sulfonate/bicarbonate transport system substrate-binding protein